MTQLSLYESTRRKREGLARVAAHEPTFIEIMQSVAAKISMERGEVCIDDLREFAEQHGIQPATSKGWSGILRGKQFQCIGRKPSAWPTNNARFINVYRYVRCTTGAA